MTVTSTGEHKAEIALTFTTDSEPSCLLEFGAADTKTVTVTDYSVSTIVPIAFVSPGYYDFIAICLTEDAIDETEVINTYVGNFIEGFILYNTTANVVPVSAPLSADVDMDLRIDNGTDVVITARLLHNNATTEIRNASIGTGNLLQFAQGNFSDKGIYSAIVSADNPLSGKIEFPITIAIQYAVVVSELLINSGTNHVEVSLPFDIDLTLTSGEDMVITYEIFNASNITTDILAFNCDGIVNVNEIKTTYQFNSTGTFFIRAAISNMVSVYTDTFLVVSQYAVNNLELNIANVVSLFSTVVSFTISPLEIANVPAGIIECSIDFGDDTGNTSISLNGKDYTGSANATHDFVAGFYLAVIICQNEIPTSQRLEANLRIENPVANIHLENSTDYIPLSVGVTVKVVLDDPAANLPLYLITCTYDFGDGADPVPVIGNVTASSTIEHLYTNYFLPGIYTITVNCSAYLTHQVLSIAVETYWDCWKTPSRNPGFFDLQFQSEQTPMVFFAHEDKEVRLGFYLRVVQR